MSVTPPLYVPHLPPVFVLMNRAGSVGKTTCAVTCAALAALDGYRVLLVDADLQTDASFSLGWEGDSIPAGKATVHDVMLGTAKLDDAVVPGRTRIQAGTGEDAFQPIPGLDLLLGDTAMAQADGELVQEATGAFWLQRALRRHTVPGQYDMILIDCPASLGRLSVSLLVAASNVIACIKPTHKELRGVAKLLETIAAVQEDFADFDVRPELTHLLVCEARQSRSEGAVYKETVDSAREMFGDRVLPMIHRSVLVPEAYKAQEPLPFWSPQSRPVAEFRAVLSVLGFPKRNG